MKVLVICQHYWPEHFQITEVCEELVVRGHAVTALVGVPNYPTGVVPEEYRDGKNREQERNGVHIVRCEETPRTDGVVGLARNYFSYARSSKVKARLFQQDEFDVVLAYQTSPVFMSAAVADAKRVTGAPALLYCADVWPDAVKAMLPVSMGFVLPVIKHLSTRIYSAADFVATNSRAYIDCFESVHKFERSRLGYVPQYADDEYLGMDFRPKPHDRVRFAVMGNIGKLQDMPCMFRAIARIKNRKDFEFHVVGTGSAIGWCKRFAEEEGLSDLVTFHGRCDYEEMPSFYQKADACLLTLNVPGAPWISSTLPSRLQGYMAAGKPVLASISGSAAEVIFESGCGRAVPAGDDEAYASLMEDFLDNRDAYASCGESGRAYFREHFTKKRFMDEIERLLMQLALEGEKSELV